MFHATCISCGEDAISIEICNAKEYAQKLPERWGKIVRESAELVMETGGYFVQYKKNAGMKDMCLSADSIVGMLELLQVSCCCQLHPHPPTFSPTYSPTCTSAHHCVCPILYTTQYRFNDTHTRTQ